MEKEGREREEKVVNYLSYHWRSRGRRRRSRNIWTLWKSTNKSRETSLTLQEYLAYKVLNGEINEESMKPVCESERERMEKEVSSSIFRFFLSNRHWDSLRLGSEIKSISNPLLSEPMCSSLAFSEKSVIPRRTEKP